MSVIIALDFPSPDEAFEFLEQFQGESLFVKVGMELFYQAGPSILETIHSMGHHIFLDLKMHDIPNTVEKAMRSIASYGVAMTTLHASGGSEMMKAARRGLGPNTMLLAVTQLTSTTEAQMHQEQGIEGSLESSVVRYATTALEAGCDAIVCSPLEVSLLKEQVSQNIVCVTPGIRLSTQIVDDQMRITTPDQARNLGSKYIVVGRPITQADDPIAAYQDIKRQFEGDVL